MNDRICDNCKHYQSEVCPIYHHDLPFDRCPHFGGKRKSTNGDAIRQGGNRALAEFQQRNTCDNCVYNNHNGFHNYCDKPVDKTCTDGIAAWLNAPAESEGE